MRRVTKTALAAGMVATIGLGAVACGGGDSKKSGRAKETKSVGTNYNKLVANQPAHNGSYSPTRDTKNFWIDTWMHDPKKLSYVYVSLGAEKTGYFVLQGLPVSYCVSLLPPEEDHRMNLGSDGSAGVLRKTPSMDGTYSSASNCNVLYGKDATSGAYVEFSVGQNQSYFLYDQPMPNIYKDAVPMGPTKVVDGKPVKQ